MTFSPAATGPANVDNGKTVFNTACMFCHGEQGEGGHGGGPSLRAMKSSAVVLQTVSEGRKEMPAFAATLTAEQIRDVAGYVSQKLATP
jgi:mono/diheme cytochrome c family protein